MARPSDFFLSVLDLFAVLLPGAVLTAMLWPTIEPVIEDRIGSIGSWVPAVGFVVVAYATGQLAHAGGSLLDRPYDRWRKRSMSSDHNTRLARSFAEDNDGSDGTIGLYKWAEAHVRIRNPTAIAEIDRQQAQSKFFRNLSVVLVIVAIEGFFDSNGSQLIGAAGLLPLAIWRFFKLRLGATEQLYLYYVVTSKERGSPAPMDSN